MRRATTQLQAWRRSSRNAKRRSSAARLVPPPCWLQIPSARGDLAQLSSGDTPVVVMEPTEYGDCVDAALRLKWTWNRLLVPEGLVRTRFVVETDVLGDDAPEVVLTEDENVVEHLSAERAGEAFREGIHVRRLYRR